jgi:pimeloyl-ACP methyl ester carboxylesterase
VPAISVAGVRVHRAGSGEPLVLVHALGTSAKAWRPVLDALSARHDVLALDLPGFGGSASLPAGTARTPEALADAVERALDGLGLPTAHLCGASLGGWVALELARRGRARSLVLISPAGFWTDGERRFTLASLRASGLQARLLRPVAELAMALPPLRMAFFGQIRRRPWRMPLADAAHDVRIAASAEFVRAREAALDGRRARPLDRLDAPATVLWGTRDLLLPARQANRVAAAVTGAAVVQLPGLGHVPMADDPRAVAEAILGATARALAPA